MNMRNRHVLAAIFLSIFVIACSEPPNHEAAIRARIDSMIAAAEAKNMNELMQPLHADFLGNGRIRKANLQGMLIIHFRRNKNVHVLVNPVEVQFEQAEEPSQAMVICHVVLAGRNQTLPEHGRVLRVESHWQRINDEWVVMSAKWKDPIEEMLR
jgi:hypothetical protein